MSETPRKVKLDAALREWPEDEKYQAEWEEKARTVEARVRAGDRGATAGTVTDDELFSAPLGQNSEDGHNSASPEISAGKGAPMTMPVDRERDRRSLQDLAKMAQMTPPPPSVSAPSGVQRAAEAKKDDSGIVDLAAAAAADPAAEQRAQTTPLASQGLFDEEPASMRPASMPMPQQPYPSVPPVPASVAPVSAPPASMPHTPAPAAVISSHPAAMTGHSATSSQVHALPEKRGNGKVIAILLGGVVAAAAVAAGVVVYAKHRNEQLANAAAAAQAAQPTVVAAAPKAEEPKPVAAAEPSPTEPTTADPNALPTAAPVEGKIAMAPKGGAAHAAAKPAGGAASKAEPAAEAKLSAKDLPTQAAGPEGDLGKAIAGAAGGGKMTEQTPAAATNGPQFQAGSVPQKPSQGAVTGAIGAVLREARACLGPDDPVSYASITFASAGNAQSVSLTGGAAGKPAEACIKGALMKAHVAPFAEPTYTARVTVRH